MRVSVVFALFLLRNQHTNRLFREAVGFTALRSGPGAALTAHRAVIHSRAVRIPPFLSETKTPPHKGGLSLFGGGGGIRRLRVDRARL